MNQKIAMPAVCWKILKELLPAPGWASSPRDHIVAGRIDETDPFKLPALPNAKDPSKALTPEQDRKWCDKECEFELMEKQVEVIQKCLKHFLSQPQLSPTRYTKILAEKFGLDE